MLPLCKGTGISSDHHISNIKRKQQPEDEAELWNIPTKSSVETDPPRWDLWRPPHALMRLQRWVVGNRETCPFLWGDKHPSHCDTSTIQEISVAAGLGSHSMRENCCDGKTAAKWEHNQQHRVGKRPRDLKSHQAQTDTPECYSGHQPLHCWEVLWMRFLLQSSCPTVI